MIYLNQLSKLTKELAILQTALNDKEIKADIGMKPELRRAGLVETRELETVYSIQIRKGNEMINFSGLNKNTLLFTLKSINIIVLLCEEGEDIAKEGLFEYIKKMTY